MRKRKRIYDVEPIVTIISAIGFVVTLIGILFGFEALKTIGVLIIFGSFGVGLVLFCVNSRHARINATMERFYRSHKKWWGEDL